METMVTHHIETKKDGSKIVRNFFFNDDKTNYLVKSQTYFSKKEKKIAKLNYKEKIYEREMLIQYLVGQPFPNMNLKISLLNNFKNK